MNPEMLTLLHSDALTNKTAEQLKSDSRKFRSGIDVDRYRNNYLESYPREDFSDRLVAEAKDLVRKEIELRGSEEKKKFEVHFFESHRFVDLEAANMFQALKEYSMVAKRLDERVEKTALEVRETFSHAIPGKPVGNGENFNAHSVAHR